jgi:hypothetical protein
LIVSRTPVDADAVLMKASEARKLIGEAGLACDTPKYFLYFPEPIYRRIGNRLEYLLRGVPLGGQYVIFGTKPCSRP